MMWMWALGALAAEPGAQRPVDLAEEAELHFQLGVKDYTANQLDEALSHLLRSYRLAGNRSTAFNIARVYDSIERPDQAWRYYSLALAGEADPELRIPIEQAMKRLEPEISRVQVTTRPPGATVFVGSRDLGARGVTPLTMALLPGKYDILLDLAGHSPVEMPRLFPTNGLFEVDATMERNEGDRRQVALETTWVETTVFVEGVVVIRAAPGRCEILPDRLQNVSAWREPGQRMPGPAPGSILAAQAPMANAMDVAVETQGSRRVTRVPLTRERKQTWYTEAAAMHAWVLGRCAVSNSAALGDTLEDLPKSAREPIVAVLAELGRGDVATAAAACVKGACADFANVLRTE